MYNPALHTYLIPINEPETLGATQTIASVQIYGSTTERLSLLRKWLRHTFPLTRKEANRAIYEMGFEDLIPCAA